MGDEWRRQSRLSRKDSITGSSKVMRWDVMMGGPLHFSIAFQLYPSTTKLPRKLRWAKPAMMKSYELKR